MLRLLARGMSNAEVAGRLVLGGATVRSTSPTCWAIWNCAIASKRSSSPTRAVWSNLARPEAPPRRRPGTDAIRAGTMPRGATRRRLAVPRSRRCPPGSWCRRSPHRWWRFPSAAGA
ncbi:MAG TPA: hypothetical protein QGG37_12755 [Chloroflexota bacterium]|nr:hypothetical protein [Chloroflexota bacterium]